MDIQTTNHIVASGEPSNGELSDHAVSERHLKEICAQVLNRPVERVRMDKSFLAQGGDSLLAIKLMARCRKAGYTINIHDALHTNTIGELCRYVKLQQSPASRVGFNKINGVSLSDKEDARSSVPLTHLQRCYFASETRQIKVFRLKQEVTESTLANSLRMLVDYHPILRFHFSLIAGQDHTRFLEKWGRDSFLHRTCEIEAHLDNPMEFIADAMGAFSKQSLNCTFAATVFIQKGTSLVQYFGLDTARAVVDAHSWSALLGDLEAILSTGQVVGGPRESFSGWTDSELSKRTKWELQASTPESSNFPAGSPRGNFRANGFTSENGLVDSDSKKTSPKEIQVDVDQNTTALLFDDSIHAVLRTEPLDFVIAAINQSIKSIDQNHADNLAFRIIVDGRPKQNSKSGDFSSTIGCFDRVDTFAIGHGIAQGDISVLRSVKDSRLGYQENGNKAIRTSASSAAAAEYVVLDSTSLTSRPNPRQKLFQEVYQWQHLCRPLLTLHPALFTTIIEPIWDQDSLKLCFSSRHEISGIDILSKAMSEFNSTLTGLLSRFRNYHLQASLDHFPLLSLPYAELDDLVSNRLQSVTKDPLRDVEDIFPCSPIQEIFLIAQGANPGFYHCSVTTEINSVLAEAPLNYARLSDAWRCVVKKHASLRTVFIDSVNRPGHFEQVVMKEGTVPLVFMDGEKDADAAQNLLLRRPVTFTKEQAGYRAVLCRRSERSALLRLDISHALVDGESFHVLFRHLSQAYLNNGTAPRATSYRDFVAYQQRLDPEDSLAYWSRYLDSAEPSLFPVEADHIERQDMRSVRLRIDLDPKLLEQFCGKYNVTTANICQLGWALVLGSYTVSNDVSFSYANSGRHVPLEGLDHAVGAFVDTMICRVNISGRLNVVQTLSKLKYDLVQGLSHPGVLAMGHDNRGKEFSRLRGNTIMTFHLRAEGELLQGSGLAFNILDETNMSEYDLTVNIQPYHSGLEVLIDYWHSRIDQQMAESISESFEKAIVQILSEDATLGEVDVVPKKHIEQIREWNKNTSAKVEALLQDKVVEQQLLRPDALAVQGWDGDFTYRDLNEISDKLAWHLTNLGVQPETKVCVYFEKSKWAAVSQLAVLKAGGVVVPLATSQPMKRVQTVLRDSEAHVVVTTETFAARFTDTLSHIVMVGDTLTSELSTSAAPPCLATPRNLAFIIYTSGSTGTPKGVMLTHESLCTSLHNSRASLNSVPTWKLGHHTRMAQFSAYSFDASIGDFFLTWHNGGCVCIISEEDRLNRLEPTLRLYEVNCAHLTPTVAGTLSPNKIPSLQALVLIGEAVNPEVVNRWIDHVALYNGYGPTECSIISSCNPFKPGCNTMNVGHPTTGAFWVTNATNHNCLVPIGAQGELLIEGPHLARGYFNDEQKTLAAFVKDPVWSSAYGFNTPKRLYRTGDLVQQKPDGSIVYITRQDTQIKLRGQRVEVNEIEHHLIQHVTVIDVAVLFPRQGLCKGRLVGVLNLRDFVTQKSRLSNIVPVASEKLSLAKRQVDRLSDYLAERVPEYMVPTVWVPLASMLPQNESSKLDRRRLGQWVETISADLFEALVSGEEQDLDQPATPLQLQIQSIWADLLNLPIRKVPLKRRSFLSLGGDSITAMKAVSQARAIGISLNVPDILQSRSIIHLSQKPGVIGVPTIDDAATDEPFALSPVQRWYFENVPLNGNSMECGKAYRYNQNLCVAIRLLVASNGISYAIETLVSKHPMLRARFFRDSTSEWYQRVCEHVGGSYDFNIHDVRSHDEVQALTAAAQESLDLQHGPVFSARLINLKSDDSENVQLLFMTAHHLVIDTASWRIICHDLEEVLREGHTASSTKSLNFRTWIRAQSKSCQNTVAASPDFGNSVLPIELPPVNLDYWELSGERNTYGDQIAEVVTLDKHHTALLLDKANHALQTDPIEILLVGLMRSFSQTYPNRPMPTIFEESHGRDSRESETDVSETVGCFTTMMPIYVPTIDSESAVDMLKRTKDTRRSILDRGLPYYTSRYLTAEGRAAFCSHGQIEVLLSYTDSPQQFGQADGLLDLEKFRDYGGLAFGIKTQRPSVFGIDATVLKDTLQITFHANHNMKHRERTRPWMNACLQTLRDLITDLAVTPRIFTLSDFPLADTTSEGLKKLHGSILPEAGIQPADVEDIYPCTPIQQGILMSQAKSPCEYQTQMFWEVRPSNSHNEVNIERFIQAYQAITNRHPLLRTLFVPSISDSVGHTFDQLVLRSYKVDIECDLCEEDDLQSLLDTMSSPHTTAYGNKPNHKIRVYSNPSGRTYAHLVINHALCDGFSLMILEKEILNAYDGRLSFDSKGPSYSEYVSYLQETRSDKSLKYWTQLLTDADACFLPTLTATGVPEEVSRRLTGSKRPPMEIVTAELRTIDKLRELSETLDVTVANIFQLAWALVLSRYVGSTDVLFGYVTSGRDVPLDRTHEMFGPLINIMMTRIKLDWSMSIDKALHQVQQDFFDGFNHQRISVSDIWHALKVEGRGLFNTCLSYLQDGFGKERNGSLDMEIVGSQFHSEYAAIVNVFTFDSNISVKLEYAPDLICRESATHLVGCLLQAVESLVVDHTSTLGNVSVVTEQNKRQICQWNAESPKANKQYCILDLVHHHQVLQPETMAVCAWDGDLTYQELDELSNQLAHHLVGDLGVGPEANVALCYDKTRLVVVAQMAVLKAGGVVTSINPSDPAQRREGILQELQANVILTTKQHYDKFAKFNSHILQIDLDFISHLPQRSGPPCRKTSPENAAFIIYTSGSTGMPKGVVLTNSSLSSSFRAHGIVFGFTAHCRVLQFASYTFDASIFEIWTTLCHGGCVCILSEAERMNDVQGAIQSYEVSKAILTSTVAALLDLSKLPSLKTLILGGEALKPAMVEQYLKTKRTSVWNGYGPAECSIVATCHRLSQNEREAPIIGRPILGSVWVIDGTGSISPVGGVGELWIEGPLLARGYLKDREKTKESFIEDPAWAQNVGLPHRRFYRTGDLARQSPSGNLIYVGRKDMQIKIRGQRVEIGEIEYGIMKCLTGMKSIAASLVVPTGKDCEPIVAAIIEPDDISTITHIESSGLTLLPISTSLQTILTDLRTSLSSILPLYMIPGLYVPVAQLPLTTSGKVDRRLLRQWLEDLSEEELSHYTLSNVKKVPPTTEIEKKFQSLWATVLRVNLDQVGAHDHFFHLGGDSYLAMQLVSMANSPGTDISLSVSDVFQHPKLVDMALTVDRRNPESEQTDEELPRFSLWKEIRCYTNEASLQAYVGNELRQVAVQCGVSVEQIEDVYPCTPLQEGLMVATAQQPRAYIGRWVYHIPDTMNLEQFKHSWHTLGSLAPILRTRIIPGRLSGALQVIIREDVTWFSHSSLSQYLESDTEKSMTYGSSLVRLAFIDTEQGQRYFVLTAHHSIYDGWSLSKMFDIVSKIYSGQEILNPPSYLPFIQYVQGQDSTAAETFWKSQLDGDIANPFPALPNPLYQPQSSQSIAVQFDIKRLEGTITMASVLRAAWALAVSSQTGNTALFAMPLSGRTAPIRGILDMIAPTITTVPVRIIIDHAQTLSDYLAAIHQQAIDMLPFEHTGLQNIRRIVGCDIDPRHLFAIQPANEREDTIHGSFLGLEPERISIEDFSSYALTVECITGQKDGTLIEVVSRFDESVISKSQLERLLHRFKHTVATLIERSNNGDEGSAKLVGEVDLVSPEEVAQLAQWHREPPEMTHALVHELVTRHSVSTPDEPAICAWDGSLSHKQLDQLSERLAHHLKSLGVCPGNMVLLCFDKSKWMMIAILATLKAGAAVVPVKADPILRLQAIVQDTVAQVLLTTPRYAAQLQNVVPCILSVDQELLSQIATPPACVESEVGPESVAFVMYTSGSTGVPKGVVLEHGAISTSLLAQGKRFGVNKNTRSLEFASYTFDMFLHDALVPLQAGGCVCIPSEEERMNDLAGAMRRLRVNYTMLTPRVLNTLRPSDCPDLQTVLVGGEIVHPEHLNPWLPQARVLHVYGPTECSIITSASDVVGGSALSLGHAIAGGLWVANQEDYHELVPIGTVGELLIEGPLLARGYLNDPAKTSAVFVDNPDWLTRYKLNLAGHRRRMYRTGDLVSQNDDGSLAYIGRVDNQVKIRGQRVDTGEIEHHIQQQTEVADVVILYPRKGPSQSRLIGFLTLRKFISNASSSDVQPSSPEQLPQAIAQASSVGQQLVGAVPEYMIPNVWITLAFMPLNNNKKIDRTKLLRWVENLDPEYFRSITIGDSDSLEHDVPADNTERQFQEVYADILNLPLGKVTLKQSFLSMGGDSITAMQVVSRCRTRYGLRIQVRDVLQSSSIKQLARTAIFENGNVEEEMSVSSDAPSQLSPIQRLYFQSLASRGSHVHDEYRFNQSVCLVVKDQVSAHNVTRATETLVSHHPMLRARFFDAEDGWKQRIDDNIPGAFHLSFHKVPSPKEAEDVIYFAQRELNIEEGPVFSINCIEVAADGRQLLFLTAHHLVVDIVSWRIILRDLGDLIQHGTSALPNESVSFPDWTRLLIKHASDVGSPKEVLPVESSISDWNYWGVTPEENVYGNRVNAQFVLKDSASCLFGERQPLRTEPIEILLAALSYSFHQVFPDRAVPTIFNEGHGREPWIDSIDLSDTVGWFTTMTPIYVSVDTDDVVSVLRRTKDIRRSIPERGIAYFASRFFSQSGREAFASHDQIEIALNFSGRSTQSKDSESLLRIDNSYDQTHLSGIGNDVKRLALFEFEASLQQDDLVVNVGFNKTMQRQDDVQKWVDAYQSSLSNLIERLSTLSPIFTLADFPLLDLTYTDLDRLQNEILPRAGITRSEDVEDIYPCSPVQESILMSQMKDPTILQVQSICEFRPIGTSTVDLDKLSSAWQTVVSRHSILKTALISANANGDSFYQVVLKQWKPRISEISCKTDKDVALTFEKDGLPVHEEGEPPHYLTFCKTKTGQIFARLSINHAIVDISSLQLILGEIAMAYEGSLVDSPAPSFGTYIEFLQQKSAAESLKYWTTRLADTEPRSLSTSTTSTTETKSTETLHVTIDDLQSLHDFRNNHGITIANMVQLAWALALSKHTGSSDVTFGYVANGRDAPIAGVNEMAGPLINMIVSRIRLGTDGLTVAQVAEQVQSDFFEAFNNQRTSLKEIQNATGLSERDLLYSVVSITRPPVEPRAGPSGLSVHGRSVVSPVEYDISLNAVCSEDSIRLSLHYSTDSLDKEAAGSLWDNLRLALFAIVRNGDTMMTKLNIADT